jgi:RNA polymerase subunit RPABC4/transcription elongation factor Spt4
VLASLPPGRHVLRISHAGGRDDERLIELRAEAGEQVIQAQLRPAGGGSGDGSGAESVGAGRSSMGSVPSIVACAGCGSRFASGVKFCGRCGGRSFVGIEIEAAARRCPRCSEGIRGEAKFCGRCGFVLAGAQPQTAETTRRVCVGCGTVFPDGVRFCGKCGSAMG